MTKNNLNAVIFAVAIVLSAIFLGRAYVNRSKKDGEISVTGLGKKDFTSDLIIWDATFVEEAYDLKDAYQQLKHAKRLIEKYLTNKGVSDSQIVFEAVDVTKNTRRLYNERGNYVGEEFAGYRFRQQFTIESGEVEKIEQLSREITDLLNQGVTLYSESPRYYYTKLSDLKIEMISKATEDARIRAEKIAENSGGELGKLKSAKMGVFQITGQNSNENFSWGGAFNTSSKNKTASITMKLVYQIK